MFKKIFSGIKLLLKTRKLVKLGLTEEKQDSLAEKIISQAKRELNYLKMHEKEIKRSFPIEKANKVKAILDLEATKNLVSLYAMEYACKAMKIQGNSELSEALKQDNKEKINKLIKNPKKFYSIYLLAREKIKDGIESKLDRMIIEGPPELAGKQVYPKQKK